MYWQLFLDNGDEVILCTPIDRGSEGSVWSALLYGNAVAVKMCLKTKCSLSNERHIYNQLARSDMKVGPKYFGYGKVVDSDNFSVGEFLCFALYGDSIKTISQSNDPLDESETRQVGVNILKQLQNLHSLGFIFCDVSPNNFLSGDSVRHSKVDVVICDFGTTKTFLRHDRTTGEVRHCDETKSTFNGTPLFASQRALYGWTQSRRDDLEAIGYVLLYLAGIQITTAPNGAKMTKKRLHAMATERDINVLCKGRMRFSAGFAESIRQYLWMCRGLKFDEKPDYCALEKILKVDQTQPEN